MLTRKELEKALVEWNEAWARHDLEAVMALFHEEVVFDNWTGGRAEGKAALRKAWAPWFAHHGGFCFTEEETFIDEAGQKALYRWRLDWPSFEKGYEGQPETRRGVDVLHFSGGRIICKLSYSKTTLVIDGRRVRLLPEPSGSSVG